MNSKIVGVDVHQVQESFDHVLSSVLCADANALVMVARVLSDENLRTIARAHMAGVRVHIEQHSTAAPAGTQWLTQPIL